MVTKLIPARAGYCEYFYSVKALIDGAVWLTPWAGSAGDPSLRLKNGFAQDDKVV
jgi:hypothetical protein